jgi:hypothetical protein
VVSKFLGVQGSGSSLEPLLGAAKTLCARPWPWVQQHLGHHVNVERYCTWGPYVATLLLRGLGLGEQRVVIAQDGDVGWPLGAVLVEASKLPGFSTAGAQGLGAQQQEKKEKQKLPRRDRKQGKGAQKARGSSLRGTGVLRQEQQAAAAAPAGLPQGHSSSSSSSHQPLPHLQHEHQAAVHGTASGAASRASSGGPTWSLGLLHHNESSPGLHLSGVGWGAVLGVAWVVLVGWARGVCGPSKAPAGSVGVFLPLTGPLGVGGPAGHGRVHGGLAHGRSKISPNRSSFRSLKS